MHEAIKTWTRETLGKLWVSHYGGRFDMEGNWIAENGRVLNWELRSGKPQNEWEFAVSFCLALGAVLKKAPAELAEQVAEQLSAEAPAGWSFRASSGYVNAYFSPLSLQDFLRKNFRLPTDMPPGADPDGYALYRLTMLHKALKARGVMPMSVEAPLSQTCLDKFTTLFLKPDLLTEWEQWCKFVSQMTAEGRLNALTPDCEAALLTFLDAVLQI